MTDKLNGFYSGLLGVVKRPGATLGRVMEEKNWIPAFFMLMVTIGLLVYLSFPAQMARMAQDPQFSELMGEEKAAYFVNTSVFARVMGCFAAIFMLFLSLVFGAFFLYLVYGIGGSQGTFVNYFALVTHASLIDTLLPTVLLTLGLLVGVPIGVVATPFLLFLNPDPRSLGFLILSKLNVFHIWYIVAIAAGVSVYAKMKFKKAMTIATLYFLVKTFIAVSASYIIMNIFKP